MHQFYITKHARERFLERADSRYKYLINNKDHTDERAIYLLERLKKEAKKQAKKINEEIMGILSCAEENRAYLNDSRFMENFHNRYGFDTQSLFLVNGPTVFVVVVKRSRPIVVTVLHSDQHVCGRSANRPKYRKKTT